MMRAGAEDEFWGMPHQEDERRPARERMTATPEFGMPRELQFEAASEAARKHLSEREAE